MYFWLRVARFILARARWIVAGVVLLTLFFAYWAVQVDIDHASGNFLSEDSDVVRNFQRASETFGEGQSALYIVFSGVAYDDPEFLRQLDSFTKRASSYDGVESVLSLTNVPALQRDGDRLVPVRLYDEAAPAEANAERFRNQPFLKGLLIAESDSATVALVNVDAAFNSTPARIDLVNQIQADARAITEDAALAGFPYLRTSYTTRVKAEAPLFTVLSLLISLLLLYAAYRSWRAVFMPGLVVVLGIVWTFGMLALFGHKINLVIAVLPALIVVIGTANAMHITTKYNDTYALLQKRRETLIDTIRVVGLATFLACLTTAVGFFVLNLSGSRHLEVFGTFASIGILFLYILSITLIPIAYSRMKPPTERTTSVVRHRLLSSFFTRLARFTERRAWHIVVAGVVVVIVAVIGATRISSDIFVFSDFSRDDPFRTDLAQFENAFGGVLPLEVVIESEREGALRNPAILRRIDQLESDFREIEPIGRAMSAAGLLKLANQAFFGGHPANFRLPSTYEMPFLEDAVGGLLSGEGNEILSNLPPMVDSTFSMTRIYLGVEDIGTEAMNALADSIAAMTQAALPSGYDVFVTGTAVTSTRSGENLVRNLVESLAVALLVISVLMAMLFRSVRLTVISVVTNALPLLVVGATMGYFAIALKPSTALIFSLAFGIAVDDTIHVLARYRILMDDGLGKREAIAATLGQTGKAIMLTSLVLISGFMVFTLSSFGGTANLGALTALTLAVALLSNLILLPALLYLVAPEHEATESAETFDQTQVATTSVDLPS